MEHFVGKCESGDLSEVSELLLSGFDIDKSFEPDNVTPLFVASRKGNDPIVNLLLAEHNASVNKCSKTGQSPLSVASEYGHENTVRILLSFQASVNQCTFDGRSPLFFAIQNGHADVVKILLEFCADINVCTGESYVFSIINCLNPIIEPTKSTAFCSLRNDITYNFLLQKRVSLLHVAVAKFCRNEERKRMEIFTNILHHTADVNEISKDGVTALHIASFIGSHAIINALIGKGANVNQTTKDGWSPVLIAISNAIQTNNENVYNAYSKAISILLIQKRTLSFETENCIDPISFASMTDRIKILNRLISEFGHTEQATKWKSRALMIAASLGNLEALSALLHGNRIEINCRNDQGETALYLACENGHENIVSLLLHVGANVNCQTKTGETPLLVASQNGHAQCVHLLLEKRARTELISNSGLFPLLAAVRNNHADICRLLLQKGGNVNCHVSQDSLNTEFIVKHGGEIQNIKWKLFEIHASEIIGQQPLFLAARNGNNEIVRTLLKFGSSLNYENNYNGSKFSALMIASVYDHSSTVGFLLERGADIDACTDDGLNSLTITIFLGCLETTKELLRYLDNCNSCLKKGLGIMPLLQNTHYLTTRRLLQMENLSPLLIASFLGKVECASLLLDHGANPHIVTTAGDSPLSVATEYGNIDIVRLFLAKGVHINTRPMDLKNNLLKSCIKGYADIASLFIQYDINWIKEIFFELSSDLHDDIALVLEENGVTVPPKRVKEPLLVCTNVEMIFGTFTLSESQKLDLQRKGTFYKDLELKMLSSLNDFYRENLENFNSVEVTELRPGSLAVFHTIRTSDDRPSKAAEDICDLTDRLIAGIERIEIDGRPSEVTKVLFEDEYHRTALFPVSLQGRYTDHNKQDTKKKGIKEKSHCSTSLVQRMQYFKGLSIKKHKNEWDYLPFDLFGPEILQPKCNMEISDITNQIARIGLKDALKEDIFENLLPCDVCISSNSLQKCSIRSLLQSWTYHRLISTFRKTGRTINKASNNISLFTKKCFGKKSSKVMSQYVSRLVERTVFDDLISLYPFCRVFLSSKDRTSNGDALLVVHNEKWTQQSPQQKLGFKIHYKSLSSYSKSPPKRNLDVKVNISSVTAQVLFKNHRNLNIITIGTEDNRFRKEKCVVLYCWKKGFIPVGESNFPVDIGGLKTKVEEGYCLFGGRPTISIGNSVFMENKQGTIGGYLEKDDCTYLLTCAHVLCSHSELYEASRNSKSAPTKTTVNAWNEKSNVIEIGERSEYVFKTDKANEVSIDAALAKINSTIIVQPNISPLTTDEDSRQRIRKAGYNPPLSFPTGETEDIRQLETNVLGKNVFKFGGVSGFTRGLLKLDGSHVRMEHITLRLPDNSATPMETDQDFPLLPPQYVMYNQTEVESLKEKPFFEVGDSGSVVFLPIDNSIKAIGMAIGCTSYGNCIMTPISDILRALNERLDPMHQSECLRFKIFLRKPSPLTTTQPTFPAGASSSQSGSQQPPSDQNLLRNILDVVNKLSVEMESVKSTVQSHSLALNSIQRQRGDNLN